MLNHKFYFLWNSFRGNKEASLGGKHKKPKPREFQKVQASPEEAPG